MAAPRASASSDAGDSASPALVATGLSKRYGDRHALRDVSVSAAPGELVALIGPNGAGKTTLLSILAGITAADGGTVAAPGSVGWVPQQPALYSKLSVQENMRLFARLEKVPDPDATVARMLEATGPEERARDEVSELSGGNVQRINIALGLMGDPAVLLLDEPSTALDPPQRERLWEFIATFTARGTTVLYSTHNVQEAERYADRVLVLAEGELVFSGTPRGLEAEVGESGIDFESAFVRFLRERGH